MAMTPTPVRSGAGFDQGAGALPPGVLEELDRGLRAQVRADGIDPQREAEAVRRMARALVEGYDARSVTGAVAPVVDAAGVVDFQRQLTLAAGKRVVIEGASTCEPTPEITRV